MTRPTRWKISFALVIGALVLALVALLTAGRLDPTLMVILAVLFLIPGRINGYYWRSFYTGRRMLDAGRYEDAQRAFEEFLLRIRERPVLKSLVWFVWGFYTRDVEAMALNNIGAALLHEGNLDPAEERLEESIKLDPAYPIPYYNLALIEELRGNRANAMRSLKTAGELGYRNTSIDKMITKAASIFAYLEGRDRTTTGHS